MKKLIVIAGAGEYPRLLVEGAKRAGVETVDVMAVKGSCERATARAADHVFPFAVGESEVAIRWTAEHGYDGAVLAGQVSPLSLFRGKFGPVVRQWLAEMPVKNAHTIFGKLVSEFEKAGVARLGVREGGRKDDPRELLHGGLDAGRGRSHGPWFHGSGEDGCRAGLSGCG